jgi:cellobiose-specific phosphotransferase system component IIC
LKTDELVSFEKVRNHLDEEIRRIDAEIKLLTLALSGLAIRFNQKFKQYTDLKSEEGLITIIMIAMIVASIIVLLIGSSIDLHTSSEVPHPLVQTVAVILFSIGIILLAPRIYLHGRDI